MLPFPARVKYINMQNQKRERIWATRVVDRVLYEIFPDSLARDEEPATLESDTVTRHLDSESWPLSVTSLVESHGNDKGGNPYVINRSARAGS